MTSGLRQTMTWMLLAAGAMGAWPAPGPAGSADKPYFIGVNYGPFHQEGQSPQAAAELPPAQILRDLGSCTRRGSDTSAPSAWTTG